MRQRSPQEDAAEVAGTALARAQAWSPGAARLLEATLVRLARNNPPREDKRNEWHELLAVTGGAKRIVVDGRTLCARVGEAFLLPAGRVYRSLPSAERADEAVVVRWHGPPRADPLLLADARGRVVTTARRLAELCTVHGRSARRAIRAAFVLLLFEIDHPAEPAEDSLLAAVRRGLLPILDRRISVAYMAESAGMSRWTFLRRFRASAGCPPATWLRRERIARAIALIRGSDMSLRTIAREVGICDGFQLSRMVTRACGQTPSDLRRRARDADGRGG